MNHFTANSAGLDLTLCNKKPPVQRTGGFMFYRTCSCTTVSLYSQNTR